MPEKRVNSGRLYDNPKYYEIAFSFRDIPAEVDLFEQCFKRYSNIPVRSVLELGCGNTPHLEELLKRGYRYHGLDLSQAMLDYSREKASRMGAEVNLVRADMVDFSLETPVDFAFIMLGTLSVKSTAQLISHFDCVAGSLNKGASTCSTGACSSTRPGPPRGGQAGRWSGMESRSRPTCAGS